MANISASMVKELREKTGAGMMDCKSALTENDGDMEAAIDWLRTKGLAKAAKKAGRIAAEGLVAVATAGTRGAVVEVNSETDFVARNDGFQQMVRDIAGLALAADGNLDALTAATYPGSDKSVSEYVTEMVGTIGENMNLRRSAGLNVAQGVVASYVHNQIADGLGKIGVLVALESSGDVGKLTAFGRQVAMHVAATNPLALTPAELSADVVERERAIFAEQARESGKPEEIIQKMVDGRMRKFYEEAVLLSQTFVIDGENTVEKAAKLAEAEVGAPIRIAGFLRFGLGEGIEKERGDFAAEVMAAASGS
jgi:elongation factor Ts